MSGLLTRRYAETQETREEDADTVSRSVVMPFAETHDFVARKHLAPTQRNRSAVSRCLSEYSL